MPDPNNAILAASKEIQRQVAHIVNAYSRSEVPDNGRWDQSPRDSFGQQISTSGPWSSPSGSGGSAADDVRHMPRRRTNRVSIRTSTHTRGSHLGDHGVGASQKGAVAQPVDSRGSQTPQAEPPSPPADSARHQHERVPGKTSSEERVSTQNIVNFPNSRRYIDMCLRYFRRDGYIWFRYTRISFSTNDP